MKNILFTLVFFICIYYLLICATTHIKQHPSRDEVLVNDYWDRKVHFLRGSWYPREKIPYIEVFSEQPPLATYLFALPFVLIPRPDDADIESFFYHDPCKNNPILPRLQPSWYLSAYMLVFSFIMGVLATISVYILLHLMKVMNKDLRLSLIFLLPATLFFTFNRFDIAPALIILMSIYSIFKKKYNTAAILLAIGTMIKMFPVLLLPVFLSYYRTLEKKFNFTMVAVFIAASTLFLLPVFIQGGLEAFKVPFQFQSTRVCNNESVYCLLSKVFPELFSTCGSVLKNIFVILSLTAVPFAVTAKIDNKNDLVKWSLLSIATSMFFMKFYSPQWIIWIIFLLILTIENRTDLIRTVLFSLITYIEFPLGDVLFGQPSLPFTIIVILKSIILAGIIFPLAVTLLPSSTLFQKIKKRAFAITGS